MNNSSSGKLTENGSFLSMAVEKKENEINRKTLKDAK